MEYNIDLTWDNEACVWIATSEDISGLIFESGSLDALIERVRCSVPEILSLNNNPNNFNNLINKTISLCFRSERHEQVYANG